ncbi:unnamed protein product [Discula destructiva]
MNGRSVSEPTRERETFKYDPSLLTDIVYNEDGRPIDNAQLRTSQDAVLTSIAALGASRLKTAASLVSLFDQKWQYIVAEATSTLTLAPAATAAERHGEQLWLCGTAIPRVEGVCEHTLVSQDPNDFERVGDKPWDLPLSLIEDLGKDVRHCTKPWCAPGSPARFYAAVPIRSRRGINIGVYCVIDTVPRKDWNDRSTQTMRELSQTIMDYLELRRAKHEYRHSERMTRGLGSFVDGKATTSAWDAGLETLAGAEGALNTNQQYIERQKEADAMRRDSMPYPSSLESPLEDRTSISTGTGVLVTASIPSTPAMTTMVYPPSTERGRVLVTSKIDRTSNNDHETTKDIFSKAANIIRESIEIEGALFLDASLKSFGGLTSPLVPDQGTSTSPSDTNDDVSPDKSSSESQSQSQSPCCDVLGFSTSHSSSVDGAEAYHYNNVPEKLLSALLRRYPRGKIFTFDEHGALESSDSSDADCDSGISPVSAEAKVYRKRKRETPWARHLEGTTISSIFQGARSVAFVPVWDAKKDRWYAGCFAFTRAATRTFTAEGELSYLKAFGILAMSETYRLEATMANKAKADVLSSISHELRSPLHGVILGVELLHDTTLDIFQGDILHTVETCGRTLLDTVDHLLDFAKINKYKESEKQQRKQGIRGMSRKDRSSTSIEDGMKSLVADVRLDVLAEEVLESVAAGSTFQRMSIDQLVRRDKAHIDRKSNRHLDSLQAVDELGAAQLHLQLQPRNVAVYLDIDPNYPWKFSVTPGSLRRILMNLFGNSLKYTREGTIKVSLTQEPMAKKGRTRRRVVKITVADTGQGISEDFLRNELFKPFSQEDSLAPGTGLGLSLVKQIVSTLGGTISIQSGVNIGTKITVALPLIPVEAASPFTVVSVTDEDRAFDAHVRGLKGLRISLHGFSTHTVSGLSDNKFHDFDDYALTESICRDWLGMEVVSASTGKIKGSPVPDVLLCTEAGLDKVESSRPPTVVVCPNTLVAHHKATSNANLGSQGAIEFVSQPIGPRKLASTLYRACQQRSELQAPSQPALGQTIRASERRLPEALAARPKLIRSHTTSDGRMLVPQVASEHSREPEVNTEAAPNGLVQCMLALESPAPGASDINNVEAVPKGQSIGVALTTISSEPAAVTATEKDPAQAQVPKLQETLEFLLVDDNAINLKILSSYMKKLKYKYSTATDGQEAVDKFRRAPGRYQCVFMDISMPVMDGFEAARRIRAFERETHQAPAAIFALSGLASADAQQEAFASGIDLFLAKPVRLRELSTILVTRGLL